MDTAAKELECFQALQKQEQLAASYRINNLWEEVQKQKELERTLQSRYGDLSVELERMQHLMDQYRLQAQRQEEMAAEKRDLELAEAAANQTVAQSTENSEQLDAANELVRPTPVGSTHDETAGEQRDPMQENAYSGTATDMDVAVENENVKVGMDVNQPDNMSSAMEGEHTKLVQGNSFEGSDSKVSGSDGFIPEIVAAQDSIGVENIVSEKVIAKEDKMANDSVDAVDDDKTAAAGLTIENHGD